LEEQQQQRLESVKVNKKKAEHFKNRLCAGKEDLKRYILQLLSIFDVKSSCRSSMTGLPKYLVSIVNQSPP
jgi:hypothetical protein